ncbi:MAG: glutamine synthetase [Pseudomonadota bacterium]
MGQEKAKSAKRAEGVAAAAAAPAAGQAKGATGRTVHLGIFDFTGTLRSKRLARASYDAALKEGWHFIDALPFWMHDETCFAERGFVDEPCVVRPDTLRPFPFEAEADLAIADYAGASADIAPRVALERQLEKAAGMGFAAVGGFEFETIYLAEDGGTLRAKGWRDLDPALTHNRCWSTVSPAADADVLERIDAAIRGTGIALDHRCSELGPGCVEYTLGPSPLLRAADDAALFKMVTKAEARRHGMTASFMAQLDAGYPGLCGHLNISLRTVKGRGKGKPAFHDARDPHGLSTTAKAFLGGICALTPDFMCLFAPTVNAYRRLRPGNWAPRTPSWGIGNYSCGVRVVSRSAEETRLELRLPGADTNAHLTAAMALAAGLWGIETGADPGPPVTENARTAPVDADRLLPTSLEEAATRFAASDIARALFGDPFVDHYAAYCRAEAAAFHAHVSAFERARYLESL